MVSVPSCITGHKIRGGLCSEGSLSRGEFGGSLSRGVFVQGCLCQGDPPLRQRPPYGNEWAVHILLECILVIIYAHTVDHFGQFLDIIINATRSLIIL